MGEYKEFTGDSDNLDVSVFIPKYRINLTPAQELYIKFKAVGDFVLSILALLLLALPFLIIGIIIKVDSQGPVFFKQKRIGKNREEFDILKFRTMKVDAPVLATSKFYNCGEYITKVGKFLRKTSIDELPQLINVILGDMSLIGYRPLIPNETIIDDWRAAGGIYQVKPGLTGLAQINGRDTINDDLKLSYDIEYLCTMSVWTDIKVIWGSIAAVFKAKDIKA